MHQKRVINSEKKNPHLLVVKRMTQSFDRKINQNALDHRFSSSEKRPESQLTNILFGKLYKMKTKNHCYKPIINQKLTIQRIRYTLIKVKQFNVRK